MGLEELRFETLFTTDFPKVKLEQFYLWQKVHFKVVYFFFNIFIGV